MDKVVLKFGGSSVKDAEHIDRVADLVIEKKENFGKVVTVVSAQGDTTDELIEKAQEINPHPHRREMDQLLATGEMISISLLAMAIQKKGHKAISLTGFQAGIHTYGSYSKSKVNDIDTARILELLRNDYIVIVAGFQGINEVGDITTLGRGGSDTSAVALAAALDAPCEIYTDVAGIYTVDPRLHPQAKKLDRISFEEAMEMANLGAKIIDPRAVELAEKFHVSLYIALNTGKVLGTYITDEGEDQDMERNVISNISVIKETLLVNLTIARTEKEKITKFFLELAKGDINIDVISQNLLPDERIAISFTSIMDRKYDIEQIIQKMQLDFDFVENVSKVSVIGNAMRSQPGVAARVFDLFLANDVDFYQVSTSEISISYIIPTELVDRVVKLLVKEFNL